MCLFVTSQTHRLIAHRPLTGPHQARHINQTGQLAARGHQPAPFEHSQRNADDTGGAARLVVASKSTSSSTGCSQVDSRLHQMRERERALHLIVLRVASLFSFSLLQCDRRHPARDKKAQPRHLRLHAGRLLSASLEGQTNVGRGHQLECKNHKTDARLDQKAMQTTWPGVQTHVGWSVSFLGHS